ncbi:9657_t:CDS:1, partial [Diversispora eburnea]
DKPFEKSRRTGANYTRTLNVNLLSNKNKFKFNPIDKKEKLLNKKLNAKNITVNIKQIVETLKSKSISKVIILLKNNNNNLNKDQITEEMTGVEENEENKKLNENQENNNTIGWTKVVKNKNKGKGKEKELPNEDNTNE